MRKIETKSKSELFKKIILKLIEKLFYIKDFIIQRIFVRA